MSALTYRWCSLINGNTGGVGLIVSSCLQATQIYRCADAPFNDVQAYNNMQTATYFQAQQPQQQAQDAQGPAAAVESYVTQALGQLQAQQGLPVTHMGEQTP